VRKRTDDFTPIAVRFRSTGESMSHVHVSKVAQVVRDECGALPLSLWLIDRLTSVWPPGAGARLRVQLYRAAGVAIGPGTLIAGPIQFGTSGDPRRNFRIGARCFLNSPLFIDNAALVTFGDGVSIGHHCILVTTDHAMGEANFRAGKIHTAPITIENGAWIAAGVTVLPGVTVGAGAVVAAGAVVTKDVPPHTLVGGVPAKFLRHLESEN
jgi:carbonic anhydrase/acetyltransferase-like protein (isoleucine patch superfamily)